MQRRKVIILPQVRDDLKEIISFITSKTSEYNALRYADELLFEIDSLSYMADVLSPTESETIKRIHPEAKKMITNNKKWNIIFHVTNNYVFVDKILPSKMIID